MEEPKNEQVKSRRDAFLERLKGKYPDKQFADDEEIYGAINDDYDNYDKELDRLHTDEKKIADMFNADGRSAALFQTFANGGDVITKFVSLFGPEIADAYDDPQKMEELAKAGKEYLERVAESKNLEKQYNENIQKSVEQIERLKEEKGYTDEQVDEGMKKICQIAYDAIVGKFSPEALEFAFAGLSHDADVENAAHEGEVRGRNANIEEKLKKRSKGDGIPVAPGGRAGATPSAPRPDLGALDRASEASSIWERGGYKRNKLNQ